jgi:hypothetical protein
MPENRQNYTLTLFSRYVSDMKRECKRALSEFKVLSLPSGRVIDWF